MACWPGNRKLVRPKTSTVKQQCICTSCSQRPANPSLLWTCPSVSSNDQSFKPPTPTDDPHLHKSLINHRLGARVFLMVDITVTWCVCGGGGRGEVEPASASIQPSQNELMQLPVERWYSKWRSHEMLCSNFQSLQRRYWWCSICWYGSSWAQAREGRKKLARDGGRRRGSCHNVLVRPNVNYPSLSHRVHTAVIFGTTVLKEWVG